VIARLAVVIAAALVVFAPQPARAAVACYEQGFAPAPGTILPPHAQVAFHSDGSVPEATATLDGKPVALKRTVLPGSVGIKVAVFEVQSNATGTLELVSQWGDVLARYPVVQVKVPAELPVTSERMYRPGKWGTMQRPYNFDGLAIHLPKHAPAIYAHVKVRRDDDAPWSELDLPVYVAVPQFHDDPQVWIGEVGCTSNYSQQLLEKGVDLEVTIGLIDGTRVPIKGLAAHLTLPPHP
jgi:hypothetical protein